MALLDVLRVGEIKTELQQAKSELEQVRIERDTLKATLLQTEHLSYHQLQGAIAQLSQDKARLLQEVDTVQQSIAKQQEWWNKQLADIQREIEQRRAELVIMDDEILLQSFGLYTPKYDLVHSDAYKAKLDQIRKAQEVMIKNGTATHCPTNWTLNNNQREGERMIQDYSKLILRAFNNECDTSIATVKFNNVEAIGKKLRKAYDTLNKLASRMGISIVFDYLTLKLEELYLCHEYQLKKQEEKEEQRRIREQMREEAKLQKEIEDAKLKVAKEEKHFAKALATVDEQLQRVASEAERDLLEKEKAGIVHRLLEIESTKQDVLTRERNTRAGYVYIISNMGSFGEHIYKIGVTRRLDPQERIDELGDASVPFGFDVHAMVFSDDAPALENALHRAFEHRRLNRINRRREFFRVNLEEIEQVVRTNFNKPVEITRIADAAEYRQSLALHQGNATVPAL